MSKTRLAYDNLAVATATTIAASGEVTTRPASFLKSLARWKKWRSTTTTGNQTVDFDFGSSQTIKAVLLADWKAHSGGTLKAQYWNGAAWVDFGTFTQASPNPTKVIALWNTAGQATTKIRLLFTNTGAVSDYVELGVVFIGSYVEPTYTLIDGFRLTPQDPSLVVAALDGQEESQARTVYHLASGTFEVEPGATLDACRVIFGAIGLHAPFFFAINPDDPDEILYGRLTELDYQHVYGDNWTIPVTVQEVR
jgi:hypothetical protein